MPERKRRNGQAYPVPSSPAKIHEPNARYEKDILDRTIKYSIRIIKLYREIEKDSVGRILGKQLLRSGTSVGANIHESQGGQSKADFISKFSIAYKEILESSYWLKLILEAKIVSPDKLENLRDETQQLSRILASIILSTKNNAKKV